MVLYSYQEVGQQEGERDEADQSSEGSEAKMKQGDRVRYTYDGILSAHPFWKGQEGIVTEAPGNDGPDRISDPCAFVQMDGTARSVYIRKDHLEVV